MKTTSVFCAVCVCGFWFETPNREFTCPHCERLIVLQWGVSNDDTEPTEVAGKSEVAA